MVILLSLNGIHIVYSLSRQLQKIESFIAAKVIKYRPLSHDSQLTALPNF